MQRPHIIAATIVTTIAAAGTLAVSGGAQTPGTRTINLVEKNCKVKIDDTPPRIARRNPAPGAGDAVSSSCPAQDSAGAHVGTFDATCRFTSGLPHVRGICQAVYALKDGDIYVLIKPAGQPQSSGVVVGGTGVYLNARGTVSLVDRPGPGDPSADTITLIGGSS